TSDADGDLRTLLSVGSGTNSASISISGNSISYVPSASAPNRNTTDHFSYVVTDGFTGGTATNLIRVNVTSAGAPANIAAILSVANGWKLCFTGTTLYTYHIERAAGLPGSGVTWVEIGSTTTDNTGAGVFVDTNPPAGQAFYRVVWKIE